ncbi:hypothetical protein FRX31_024600 [Thalictrum thalictroides]|uniref:Uncharacterized protein n=1 Tax=Thalictrum thalictroides TaxID=46969 RepID=A0A7J6VM36_THATH|nr:hypothetical protein FRX31_024600 [Thalictrum thalictroides]
MAQTVAFRHQERQVMNQHGWHNTSDDYRVHIAKMERMPSTIEAPHYPSVHMLFNNNVTPNEHATRQEEHVPVVIEKPQVMTEATVHIEKAIEDKPKVNNKDVDAEAEYYILQKHKAFNLCKWLSMKAL